MASAAMADTLYSHDGSQLNVIPVLASRSQALRLHALHFSNNFLGYIKHQFELNGLVLLHIVVCFQVFVYMVGH